MPLDVKELNKIYSMSKSIHKIRIINDLFQKKI